MADISDKDIADYGSYLKSQGHAEKDIKAYTDYLASQKTPSAGDDTLTLIEKHASQGLAPLARGVGGYIGKAIGTLEGDEQNPNSSPGLADWFGRLSKAHEAGKSEFSKVRQEQIDAEADASARNPGLNASIAGANALVTAPLTAMRGSSVLGKLGWGAVSGGGQAALRSAGHADSLDEFVGDTATGAAMGTGIAAVPMIAGTAKSAWGAIPQMGKDLAKKSLASAIGFKTAGPLGAMAANYFTPASQELAENAGRAINGDLWGTVAPAVAPPVKEGLGLVSAKGPELIKGFVSSMGSDIKSTGSAMERRQKQLQGR